MSFYLLERYKLSQIYESIISIYLIELMFQKETIPISFGEKYTYIRYVFRALNSTLVFLV